jgi:cytochrome c6
LKTLLAIALTALITFAGLLYSPMALAVDDGASVFEAHCAGCHINGGNIVRRGKNLKLKTLQKNQMDSLEAIALIVSNGKNNMSAYKNRLSEQQIQAVAAYVLEQAKQDWKK